jgi:hypothetical protein
MIVNIIIDASGSMAEMAKTKIERLALDSLVSYARHFRADLKFRVFLWNESFREAAVETEIQGEGGLLFAPLAEYFSSQKNSLSQNEPEGWLLMSDGCWDGRELDKFPDEVRKTMPKVNTLAIGADADFFMLKKIAGRGNVFPSEDVLLALESCFCEDQKEVSRVG